MSDSFHLFSQEKSANSDSYNYLSRPFNPSANNELLHLCAEVSITGEDPPFLEDVLSILFEDVAVEAGSGSDETTPSHVPASRSSHRRALRANHLRHNRFIRSRRTQSQRRLEDNADTSRDLMDALSITGGYNGEELYIELEIDASKLSINSIEDLVRKPFEMLKHVEFIAALFPPTNASTVGEPLLNSIVSFSAGAHACVRGEISFYWNSPQLFVTLADPIFFWITTVGIDITPEEVFDILFSKNTTLEQSFILNNSFIQFEDVSAKFALSASVSGNLNLQGVTLGMNGTFDLALGLGMDRSSEKIYFSELKSIALSLRDQVSWQKIGILDVSLPITFDLGAVGNGLEEVLNEFPNLSLILSINADDLFRKQLPSVNLDLDLL